MKDIIFKGSSHTIGLGLDLVLSKRYNDDEWLKQNGVILPPQRTQEDWDNINNHRWPKIVCETLGIKEYDFADVPHLREASLPEFITKLALTPPEILSEKVSHIIYEPQTTRLFYEHIQWTPTEMLRILNDTKVPESDKQFIYDWLDNYDENIVIGMELLKRCMEIHKDIQFVFFLFYGTDSEEPHLLDAYKQIENKVVQFTINGETSSNLHSLLKRNKLRVCDTAYCYTNRHERILGNALWKASPHEDFHAGVEAQQMIADNILRHLNGTPTAGTTRTI